MSNTPTPQKPEVVRPWLFPVTYLIHVAEEYWVGGGYFAHLARTKGVSLTPLRFIVLNGVGLGLMILGIFLARKYRFLEWLLVCLATVAAGNGVSHTITALRTTEYNPGLVSGLIIWVPLGAYTLFSLHRRMAGRRFWSAVGVGVAITACVSLLALSGGKIKP